MYALKRGKGSGFLKAKRGPLRGLSVALKELAEGFITHI